MHSLMAGKHRQPSRSHNYSTCIILPNYTIINFRLHHVLYKDFVEDFVKLLTDIQVYII